MHKRKYYSKVVKNRSIFKDLCNDETPIYDFVVL